MWHRVGVLFRAGFAAHWRGDEVPVAPLVVHGSVATALALILNDGTTPYAYALVLLSFSLALIALPLLGDLGFLLRADPAREWIEAQPVRPVELRLARTLILLVLVGTLASAALVPICVLAPGALGFGGRLALFAAGLGQAFVAAAILLAFQSLLGRRAEGVLVLLQTLLVGGVILGILLGLRLVPQLTHVSGPSDLAPLAQLAPPTWFAVVASAPERTDTLATFAPWIAVVVAAALLFLAPQSTAAPARARSTLGWVLTPVRRLATRFWVSAEERGAFDLVYDALPLEREFVLRTYPLIGIPLAMLLAGSSGAADAESRGLLAVLLFTPATYLPILLVYVPASSSHDARWILDGAPVRPAAIHRGAVRAIVVRFLVPLYAVLFAATWTLGELALAARLAPVGFLVSAIALDVLYARFVSDVPLSRDPESIEARLDWTGTLLVIALLLTGVAIVAYAYVSTWPVALGVCAALAAWIAWTWRAGAPSAAGSPH